MPIYDEDYWREEEEYNRQCEQEYERQQSEYYFAIYQQEQEDRNNYPLFFWRETCRKDSDQRETCKPKEKK